MLSELNRDIIKEEERILGRRRLYFESLFDKDEDGTGMIMNCERGEHSEKRKS